VTTPDGARARRLFWVQGVGALKVLETPELYESLFPGYEAARGDAALWRRYFTEVFDQTVYTPALVKASRAPSLRVSASSFGNMDLYLKYGADVLLYGVSDTFISTSAGMLSEELDALGAPGKKVLVVARGNLTAEAAAWYAQGLQARPEKSALTLWGYSLTTAHRPALANLTHEQVLGLYRSWRAENNIARFDFRFPHPSWDSFVGGPALLAEDAPRGIVIPDAAAAGDETLDAFLEKADASPYSIGLDEADCDTAAASRAVDRTLAEMLKVSDRVLLYLPPTSPLDRRGAPACALANLKAMLESKAGPRVTVETSDWTSYGLTNRDYLYPAGAGRWKIDPVHANDAGARKISRRLAGLARRLVSSASHP